MKRLIINFNHDIEPTLQRLGISAGAATLFARDFPDADRVTVTWNVDYEVMCFKGRRHFNDCKWYKVNNV